MSRRIKAKPVSKQTRFPRVSVGVVTHSIDARKGSPYQSNVKKEEEE